MYNRAGCVFVLTLLGFLGRFDVHRTWAAQCADISGDGKVTAGDCLAILRVAVGLGQCEPACLCDTNGNGPTTSADALRCLRVSVGQAGASLDCTTPCCADPAPLALAATTSFGILSETAPAGLQLDVDSFLGIFQGAGGTLTNLHQDLNDHVEGKASLSATVNVDADQNQYAGWFVSAGTLAQASDNTVVRNMSSFSHGRIVFWIKSPVDLIVGIRSGNVASGTETSKLDLSDLSPGFADECWHRMCVPLDAFEGPPKDADLSRIKVFFVIASSADTGGTDGSRTFLVDDVRWETAGCD